MSLPGRVLLALAILLPAPASALAVEEELAAFLRARAGSSLDAVEVPELPLADAERALEARFSVNPSQPLAGWVPVRVSLLRQGRLVRSLVARAHVTATRDVVVARRRIAAGQRVSPEDLELQQWPAGRVPRGALGDPDEAEGQRARRAIAAGAALVGGRLEPVPDVERGQRVKIRLVQGALTIETHGTAQEGGVVGEWIRVRSAASPRVLSGRIGTDGVLHVEL